MSKESNEAMNERIRNRGIVEKEPEKPHKKLNDWIRSQVNKGKVNRPIISKKK
jgi:hypothetical protein